MENLVGLNLDSAGEGFKEGCDLSFSGLWKDDSSCSVERRLGQGYGQGAAVVIQVSRQVPETFRR